MHGWMDVWLFDNQYVRCVCFDPEMYNYVSGSPMWCAAVKFAAGRSAECWGISDVVDVGFK